MTTLEQTDQSAKKAARRALIPQFGALRKHLLQVLDMPTEAERIHKLRVAVRRATAALDAFAPCLPRRTHRRARRALRDIRRTAGAARDWDVFFPVVGAWANTQPDTVRPFADALLGWSASKRDSAHAGLLRLADAHPAGLDDSLDELLAALRRPKGDPSVADLGRARVAALQAELAAACEHEPTADAEYHTVRIVGKRLRYAAELFADHLPDAERIDDDMRALQDVLGRFNDAVVGESHLTAFADHFQKFHPTEWERLKPGADALGEHFAAVRAAERQRFHEWREVDRVGHSLRE
jgi:CHAD domain-containing protein